MEQEYHQGVPHLSIVVDENDINGGAIEILKKIRPNWKLENIEFKLLTDGITNKLVGCRSKDVGVEETVLVRVYGNKTDLLIDRKAETRTIILLSKLGLAPSLYATYTNGLAYQFVPGCTLTEDTVKRPEIAELIARRMAKLHKVKVPGEENPKPCLWEKIQKFLDLVPEVFSDSKKHKRFEKLLVPKSKIQNEIDDLKKILSNLECPIVFCHNDLLLGNVIYTEDNNSVTFIDYEYAAYNYQAFDIANHFLEYAGVETVNYDNLPDEEYQKQWIRIYLSEYKGDFSESEVNKLYYQVNKFFLIDHLFWGVWALIQTEHSYIDFDFLGYGITRFNEYFLKKDQVLSMELPR